MEPDKEDSTHAPTRSRAPDENRDWLALPKDKRNDLVRRAQCDLLGSFRHCTDKRCRRARWCAGGDPRACKDRLWKLRFKLKGSVPKTLRNVIATLEDVIYWRT